MRDKPEILNVRLTVTNKLFLDDLKLLHKIETTSEIARKLFYNAEELFKNGIDISDINIIKKIRNLKEL